MTLKKMPVENIVGTGDSASNSLQHDPDIQ